MYCHTIDFYYMMAMIFLIFTNVKLKGRTEGPQSKFRQPEIETLSL